MISESGHLVCVTMKYKPFSILLPSPGHTQSFSCDAFLYKPLCPGTVGKCTCVVNGTTSSTRWSFFTSQSSLLCNPAIDLTQAGGLGSTCPLSMGTCGLYLRAANQRPAGDQGPCQTSTLNITADPHLNGVAAECKDLQSGLPGALIGNITIQIVGKQHVVVQATLWILQYLC